MIGGRVLDGTVVTAIAAGTSDYADALLAVANELGIPLAVPTTALQAAWQVVAPTDRHWLEQLPLASMTVVLDLDAGTAHRAGVLAADAGLPATPAASSHAAAVGLDRGWPVVTREPDLLLALSGDLRTETMP